MKIKYNSFISWQKIGETVFVINEISKQMYFFDDIATEFWLQIEKSINFNSMIENLISLYEMPEYEISNDVKDFLLYLKNEDLIIEEDDYGKFIG